MHRAHLKLTPPSTLHPLSPPPPLSIGRLLIRYLVESGHTIAHLNDVCSLESAAYLLQYDSVHGTWSVPVVAGDGFIKIGGVEVPYTQEGDPAKVEWPTEVVCCCTGKFLKVPILTSSYLAPPTPCKKVRRGGVPGEGGEG